MYKSKVGKPHLRIGLSRSEKSQPPIPIKIPPLRGVRTRTLGLSRSYKTPKNIDNLVKSPLLTNPLRARIINNPKEKTDAIKDSNNTKSNISISEPDVLSKNNDFHEEIINVKSPCGDKVINSVSKSLKYLKNRSKQCTKTEATVAKDSKECSPITMENEDVSISYSPLETFDSTPNKGAKNNLQKTKRIILGSLWNSPKCYTSPETNTSISNTSKGSSANTRKLSRLSLKKSSMELTDDENENLTSLSKRLKISSFGLDISLASNISDCSVVLERFPNESLEEHLKRFENSDRKEQNAFLERKEKVVEFIDLSQNSQDNIQKKQLIDSIMTLDQVLKSKQIDLDALKQNVIYKKKHNYQELTAVANCWKNGCRLALNDLAIKLQHVLQSNMSMDLLLKQLNVPDYIFKYDPEIEELV